ncbi:MAG TPA: beta-ketoacyl-[acyl-carrier-protein] synthase family protein [Gallionellaceae bacterium]|nr:beta-ketoacyl-[acyl-carrier-protein] synthase family protein [Gallionellaceae bacterium]
MGCKVVVTGLGIVSPVGSGQGEFFENLMAGRSGIRRVDMPHSEKLSIHIAGTVPDFDPTAHFTKMQLTSMERFSQMALVAARQAVQDAEMQLEEAERTRAGVMMGTGMGGAGTLEEGYLEVLAKGEPRVRPLSVVLGMNNAAASHISMEFGLRGPNITYSTACSSSAIAIGEAARQIRHGYADVMLAGGSEALLTVGVMKAWEALRTLALEDPAGPGASCKPFSRQRNGLVLGEGACVLVLENAERAAARGARIYAELAGYACASDASHISKPDAAGQARAIRAALADACMQPADIGYINAHGTATLVGDVQETRAIKEVFGSRAPNIPVSSTKSMHGHLMGATGAVEFMTSILAMHHKAVPPTINLNEPDPECDLDYVPNVGRHDVPLGAVMSNSFAFGGSNAVLIARRYTS